MFHKRFGGSVFGRSKEKPVPKPTKTGLPCPICEHHTVERDVSNENRWFVEWCRGGVLRVGNSFDTDDTPLVFFSTKAGGDYTPALIEFDCPYYDAGFER